MKDTILIRDILKERNPSTGNHRNPVISGLIAKELRAKGYEMKIRRVNGKSCRVWVKKDRKPPVDAKALVAKALGK